jgi:hypothetical protein
MRGIVVIDLPPGLAMKKLPQNKWSSFQNGTISNQCTSRPVRYGGAA